MFPVSGIKLAKSDNRKNTKFKQSSRTTLNSKLIEQMEKLNLPLWACSSGFLLYFLHQECGFFSPNENKNIARTYGIYLAFQIESATSGQPHITVSNILFLIYPCIISS